MIEVITDTLSIQTKLEKARNGIVMVDPQLIKDMEEMSENIENFIIDK